MIRGLYSAATAMNVADQNHEVVADNLAHLNVPGYRRHGVAFQTFDRALSEATGEDRAEDLHGTQIAKHYRNFELGPVAFTGNPLDVAVSGDSFFVIQGPNGPMYTRNGTFTIGPNGQLQTRDGRVVSGTGGGAITIPPSAAEITIGTDGTISADGARVGQLQLASFQDPNLLVPVGTTLFSAPNGVQPQTGTGTVQQGYQEGANVKVVNEMVSMIAGMRHAESAQRALRSLSDALQLSTRPQG
jgi:flagellar basal-body rod protein FlgF